MNTDPDDVVVEQTIEQEAMAAFDKAIEETNAAEVAEVAPVDEVKPVDEVAPVEAKTVDGSVDTTAEAAKPEAVKPDDETTKEITALGLKGKSSERFQQMAGEIKTFAPIKEALEKAGIKDVAEIPHIIERAKVADQWEEMAVSTNATPEQMGMAFDYLKYANAAVSGDVKAAEKCYEYMAEEMKVWAKMLGKDVPGVVDPLEGQDDLLKAVDEGEITRAYALQIAANRTQGTFTAQRDEQLQQRTESEQLFNQGTSSLNELGDVLEKADPHYQAKLAYFVPIVKTIRETCHPSEWAKRSRDAYLSIPDPAPAPVARVSTPTPIRPGGLAPGLTPVTDDPYEAMELGIAAANGMR